MVQIQVRPPVRIYGKTKRIYRFKNETGVGSRRRKAAVDLTIEENVLKKILQEKKIMSDARNCVERKQLMLRDKKTLY